MQLPTGRSPEVRKNVVRGAGQAQSCRHGGFNLGIDVHIAAERYHDAGLRLQAVIWANCHLQCCKCTLKFDVVLAAGVEDHLRDVSGDTSGVSTPQDACAAFLASLATLAAQAPHRSRDTCG